MRVKNLCLCSCGLPNVKLGLRCYDLPTGCPSNSHTEAIAAFCAVPREDFQADSCNPSSAWVTRIGKLPDLRSREPSLGLIENCCGRDLNFGNSIHFVDNGPRAQPVYQ